MDHQVLNQAPPLENYNAFSTDSVLRRAVAREGAGWACRSLDEFGAICGSREAIEWGVLANRHPPVLETHDRFGNRRDEVEFHPAYHELTRTSIAHGVHSLADAEAPPREGSNAARAAALFLASQMDAGHTCPLSMTHSAAPAIRQNPELAREWIPRMNARSYDPEIRGGKTSALIGMAMTEKQGGSDVRANTTRAEPISAEEYAISGHKWFCSAPMSDAFLVLAQAPAGLSCFFLPRITPDGRKNGFHLQRLKQKLGNRSNASSEVEFERAWARRIGEEGRGVAAIIEMVHHTRLDCVVGAAALMRQAVALAIHHARNRKAFGSLLIDQPLMRAVLADLVIESEAATVLAFRIARAFDENDRSFARLAVAVAKYWVTKRSVAVAAEALECLGGNGYVEESLMPRLYREAPLNSIWEGSGNVICLDILRTIRKEPESLERFLTEVRLATSGDSRLNRFADALRDLPIEEAGARRLAESLALALQASLMVRHASPASADAFCGSRLDGSMRMFGTLRADVRGIFDTL